MTAALPALAVFAAAYLVSALRGARWVHLPAALLVAALGVAAMRPAPSVAAPEPLPVAALPAEDAPAAPLAIPPGVPERMARWHELVVEAAAEAGLDPLWLYAYMEVESGGDPAAISVDSAVGLMQIIPREKCAPGAFAYACERPTTAELLDPAFNLRWAAAHIAGLHARYGAWEGARRYYGYTPTGTDEWYADTVTGNYARLVEAASAPATFAPLWPTPGNNAPETRGARHGGGRSYWPFFHIGLDILEPEGTPVFASEAGTVVRVGNVYDSHDTAGLGRFAIIIQHEGGYITTYGHNSAALVAEGERVARGQIIARVGSLGNSSEPHVHWEVSRCPYSGDPMYPTALNPDCYVDPLTLNIAYHP